MPVSKHIARVSASLLNSVAADSDADSSTPVYDSKWIPNIGLDALVERWAHHTETGDGELLHAVALIDRFCLSTGAVVTQCNMHRILISALLVATKYSEDTPFPMSHYARVAGVEPAELARLERSFLRDVEWNLVVDRSTVGEYLELFQRNPQWDSTVEEERRHGYPRETSATDLQQSGHGEICGSPWLHTLRG